ncbi:MAG: biopolymer transporter ExbD [Verrucomicrobiae bacterium]|nr:biopolymer transporter ExbD [Verrucomicrobiae bacterium]MCX7723112.1 biopolymer transporter ExbD [Verrucomicrobiae bacterium]MDW7981058.1 biopolymer transporter ExbD [Verrucomicrobiales bacterium]
MRFFIRKRRQTPTVIIVALIDVLIVLLIFLMVTTTFRQQPALRLALPESEHAQRPGASEAAPLVVWIDEKGALWLGHETRPVTAERLKQELIARAQKDPGLKLAISADRNAPFGQVIKVMDAAKAAGIKSVNAFTKERQERVGQ